MVDVCLKATSRAARLEVSLAFSTRVVENARKAHDLAPTSCVALGRLLTATGLVAVTSKREGTMTAQVTSKGRVRQLVADANEQGHLRGYARPADLAFPLTPQERATGRRLVGAAVRPGQLSVVRRSAKGEYGQSAVDAVSGEIDLDMQHYLEHSDQVPTVLAAEVLLGEEGVEAAAGVLVQAMPDGDLAALDEVRARLANGGLAQMLKQTDDPQALMALVMPDAEVVEVPTIFVWKCRCSYERVVRSLQMLSPIELAEMIESGAPAEVNCDFCGTEYSVPTPDLQGVFELIAKAKG